MKLLFCGDVVGKSGRRIVEQYLPLLREKWALDFVVLNGENAAHGFGLTPKFYEEFKKNGVDVITLGNHSFDKKDIIPTLDAQPDIIRPMNYPENTVGKGYCIYTLASGYRIAVVQLLGQVGMAPVEDPFAVMQSWLKKYVKGRDYEALVVDFHADATAEKRAMAYFLDGRALLVAGTHTHIPTADAMVLSKGTGYITDVGMCGDYASVIGMTEETSITRFLKELKPERFAPAEGPGTFCGIYLDFDEKTLHINEICPVRIGAHLHNTCNFE
ncbi:MAG: TIGR00282 family metallophosphoesterase [Lactobacillales bacterium]|jgi:metallophosphoesterase (TIGR00282 family)|nr:TIGR00282 family metallophosphoesterase [Lactobacillales bacterium]